MGIEIKIFNEVKFMLNKKYGFIEKSGTGIGKSPAWIEKSGTGIAKVSLIITVLLGVMLFGAVAWAVQGEGTGNTSTGAVNSSVNIDVNGNLATLSFNDGYRVVSGYGYIDRGYARISLYSLEYVYAIGDSGNSGGASLLVQGEGTGTASAGDGAQTIPVQGEGTGSNSAGDGTAPVQGEGTGARNNGAAGNQQLKAWGIAEVVLSEGGADMIVYQLNDEGVLSEAGVYSGVEVH